MKADLADAAGRPGVPVPVAPPIPQAEHRPEMSVFLLCVTYECILRQWNCLLSKASVQPPAIGTTCDSQTKLCILPIGATLLLCWSEKNSN